MPPRARVIAFVATILVLCSIAAVSLAKTLSRDEVDRLWEQLLRDERYEAIQFYSKSSSPSVYQFKDKRLAVQEERGGYLWGLFGLSEGGSWFITRQLEAEVPTRNGLLQLYSKAISKWSPGFTFVRMPGYDPQKYPKWEFRLVLRNPTHRGDLQTLKSVYFGPDDVVPTVNPDRSAVRELIGQRVPRGELQYDSARNVAIVRILGLRKPITLEIPV